jgi:GPH family glycoside/pentoside/hexuronide:cation symporter/probable glucitol transport protein GutA
MTKAEIIDKAKGLPGYVKNNWKKPNEGEYLTLKEMFAYTLAQGGTYVFSCVAMYITFSANYFCGAVMGIATLDFSVINIISTVLGYALMFMNPVNVLIYENHGRLTKKMKIFAHCSYLGKLIVGIGCYFLPQEMFESVINGLPQLVGNILVAGAIWDYIHWFIRRNFCAKYGRFKPFVLICGIPAAIMVSAIPFLPVQNMTYTNKLIVLHFAFTLMSYFYNNYIGINTLVTFMTPNSQERQKLHSIAPILSGLFSSIVTAIWPMIISSTGGYLSIKTYRIFIPIFVCIGTAMSLLAVFCKERIIEPPMEKRAQVTFFKGAKNVLKNKYFWITNISNVIGQWHGLVSNLLSWWFVYSLRMEWFSGIAGNLVVIGMTFGNILCPIMTKRFQKKNILITFRGITILTVLGIALAVKMESIAIFLIALFLKNTIAPVMDGVNIGLNADILTYHQWKYGERADAMSGVFGWFLNPINVAIGYIMPWLLSKVGFTSDWDVLFDSQVLNNVFNLYTWGSVIGLVLLTVPFFFYDLTREKHDMCVKELEERLALIEADDTDKN